jgi:phospholipid/cholesterol/gamma-HCH transport system substrate-binding protein
MRVNDALKVGVAVLIALAALIYVTFALPRAFQGRNTYEVKVAFDDARGIAEGAPVRVSGVDKGTVSDIDFDSRLGKPVLTLRIKSDYPLGPNDAIRIAGGLIGFNPPWVEITPGGRVTADPAPGGIRTGDSGPNTDKLVSQGEKLLSNLTTLTERMTTLTDNMTRIAGDPRLRTSLVRTLVNLDKLSGTGVDIARNMKSATAQADRLIASFQGTATSLDRTLRRADTLLAGFRGTATQSEALMKDARAVMQRTNTVVENTGELMKDTRTVIQNAGGLVTETRTTLAENRVKLAQVLDSLNASLKNLDKTLTEATAFLTDEQMRADLKATAANTREATANLQKITADLESLTGDPQAQEDLRATIGNLRAATEEATEVFRRVRGVLGGGGQTAKNITQRLQEAELRAEVVRTGRSERTRVHTDATLPWSANTFYRLGLFDFGENTRINAQAGQQLRRNLWVRYGIYASKLGAGVDFGSRQRPSASVDLFGLDRPRLDLRGNIPLNRSLDLTIGVDRVFQAPDPVFGVRYHK